MCKHINNSMCININNLSQQGLEIKFLGASVLMDVRAYTTLATLVAETCCCQHILLKTGARRNATEWPANCEPKYRARGGATPTDMTHQTSLPRSLDRRRLVCIGTTSAATAKTLPATPFQFPASLPRRF